MASETSQYFWRPRPVLHDLRRRLAEVRVEPRPIRDTDLRPAEGPLERVAEFVKERHHIVVCQERGVCTNWRRDAQNDLHNRGAARRSPLVRAGVKRGCPCAGTLGLANK